MHLNDEVGALVEPPRHVGRFRKRDLARRPTDVMTAGTLDTLIQPVTVARLGILLVEPPSQSRSIQSDYRMVDDSAISGMELNSAHISRRRQRDRNDKIPEHVMMPRREAVCFAHFHDEVRLPHLPLIYWW